MDTNLVAEIQMLVTIMETLLCNFIPCPRMGCWSMAGSPPALNLPVPFLESDKCYV